MSEDRRDFLAAVIIFALGMGMGAVIGDAAGYETGQRDALNGKWKWLKVKDVDGKEIVVEKR